MADAGLFWLKSKSLDVWQRGDTRGLSHWLDELTPNEQSGERVLAKKYPSAFFGTTLATELRVAGVDTIVVCGVSTSGCVRATVLDAMCYGFRPMVRLHCTALPTLPPFPLTICRAFLPSFLWG
jgi:nicotinamidase-related amidase